MINHVCAIVVTYNRPVLLRECLGALRGQTRPPDQILVVDNDSTDGTREVLRAEFPEATTLALAANGGGAAGFHHGMKWAHRQGFDWLWLMDDDARPDADCLQRLLAHAEPGSAIVPLQLDNGGRLYGANAWRRRHVEVTAEVAALPAPVRGQFLFTFVGPLLARGIIDRIGLPNKDFFIWYDDFEYCLRMHNAGLATIIVPDARFFHDFGAVTRKVNFLFRRSNRSEQPAWKTYYGVRNAFYSVIRTKRDPASVVLFLIVQFRLFLMDIVYGPERAERVRLHLLGLWDGATGRLGKRVAPGGRRPPGTMGVVGRAAGGAVA